MMELQLRGVMVIELPPNIFENFNMEEFLNEQREFKVSNPSIKFVLGSFGALANPCSQHHPTIRKLRKSVYSFMKPLFASTFEGKYLELIPDRFSIRNQDQPINPESWHRDVSAQIGPNDCIFGGYVNMDERQTQYFSCIPGSHNEDNTGEGFYKLSKENTPDYNARREIISVPPRCAIIFNENIIHEIARRKIKESKSYRQYFKWRISENPVSTLGHQAIMNAVVNQGVFPLHAIGKKPNPPMYYQMHIIHWGDKIEEFSQNVRPEFLSTPNKKGQIFVKQYMPSLIEAGIETFPEYTDDEISILFSTLL